MIIKNITAATIHLGFYKQGITLAAAEEAEVDQNIIESPSFKLMENNDILQIMQYDIDPTRYAIKMETVDVGPLRVSRQADCSVALPVNTTVRGYVAVTTAGTGATTGDLLYDDGSATGFMTIIPETARAIFVAVALSGGTITFDPDSIYLRDTDGGVWVKIGDIGSTTGCVRSLQIPFTTTTVDSTNLILANYKIHQTRIDILTPFSAMATIAVQSTVSPITLMATGQNLPQVAGPYIINQNTSWEAVNDAVRVVIGGAPVAGAGIVTVNFSSPIA